MDIVRRHLDSGAGLDSLEKLITVSLESIGRKWEAGSVALAQIYLSGKICEDIMAAHLPEAPLPGNGRGSCAIALLNDHHQLGKRMVLCSLRSAGFDIADWGMASVDQVVKRTLEESPEVLLLSTLMLASALHVKDVRAKLDAGGYPGKLLVGGAPFRLDKNLWREVGADATADNAMESISVLGSLLGGRT